MKPRGGHGRRRREQRRAAQALADTMYDEVMDMRARFPRADYVGRVFFCVRCSSLDGAVAPRRELPPNYGCLSCGRPQTAVTSLLRVRGADP